MPKISWNWLTYKPFALSAIAGIVAGAIVALYVISGQDGKLLAGSTDEATCTAAEEKIAAVEPAIQGEVAALIPAEPSQPLTDLSFNGPDGEMMSVADFSGKTLLINLWATWCAPCRAEMPALDELQADKGSDRFEVVAVNVDRGSDEKPQAFLNEIGIQSLADYRDSSMEIFNELKTRGLGLGLPVTVLVDEEGCLLAHMNGPAEWSSDDAQQLIEAALPSES
ncbi:thiol:disulfide interchange protein TlpA [Chelativorans sp. YIM 93263]|uniref:thiol:disulfide interchange protein TlpA n=1 Tax=Chelativorans sp. YIM 93263 TaxID=2906648 RepID=UPI002379D947|nr:TlpA disulfide reductase family protein [Chelativorans sp. YIM 93263]